jgi:hypothetical protein
MEDLLTLYAEPLDPARPVVCFDERPVQLVSETRTPLPVKAGQPRRYDYEYQRAGTCNLFMLAQPLAGWRHVKVTDQRTAQDVAHCLRELVDVHFPQAQVIRLVLDNLNVHTLAVLYETFAPDEARRIIEKLEVHYTPKHGSWLNQAEIELAVLSKQCLQRRIPTQQRLRWYLDRWERRRNRARITINWRFKAADARVKLKRLYPSPS